MQALLDAEAAGKIPDGEIVLVLSDKADAYALTRAKNAGKKGVCVDKASFPDRREREKEMRRVLEENGVEMIVLAGFLAILSEEFTGAYAGRIINVHPSLIPSFCGKGFYGLKVHEEVLKRGGAFLRREGHGCDGALRERDSRRRQDHCAKGG